MRLIVSISILVFSLDLFGQFDSEINAFLPHREGKQLYLSQQPFSKSTKKIKVDAFDFPNSTTQIYVVKRNNYFGLIDVHGKQIEPFSYDSIVRKGNDLLLWKQGAFDYFYGEKLKFQKIEADSMIHQNDVLYYFKNGKCGLLKFGVHIKAEHKAIRPWRGFVAKMYTEQNNDFLLAISSNNDYQLLDEKGRALLPQGVSQINEISFGIIRFFDGTWKYYLPNRDLIVSSDGNDITFYSQDSYKKYNAARNKATFYLLSDNKNYNTFDDYFPLDNKNYLAVKKGDSIGLINANTQALIIPPKYQQINILDKYSDEFRCYQNKLCGIVNAANQELVPMEYHNVQKTPKSDYYATYKNTKMGLVKTGGKEIIPNNYKHINFINENNIILHQPGKYGLANYEGKIVCPVEYENYRVFSFKNYALYQFQSRDSYVLYNESEKLYDSSYKWASFGNDCVKIYTNDNKIVVLYLDENGNALETYTYANLTSVPINDKPKTNIRYDQSITFDELEENQLTGKFGKRYYAQAGMSVEPIYNTIIRFNNRSYIMGETDDTDYSLSFVPNINVKANKHWNDVSHKSNLQLSMYDDIHSTIWSSNSYSVFRHKNGKNAPKIDTRNSSKFSAIKEDLLYGESIGYGSIRKLTFGTSVSVVPVEQAVMSLYDYYLWNNNLGLFQIEPEDLAYIMNPNLGVKFNNPRYLVCELSYANKNEKRDYFDDCPEFELFEYFPHLNIKYFKKKSEKQFTWQHMTYDNLETRQKVEFSEKFRLIENSNLLAKQTQTTSTAEIHESYPNFSFMANSFNKEYKNGVIIQNIGENNFRLILPDNSILLDGLESVKNVSNGLFLVRKKGEEFSGIYSLAKKSIVVKQVKDVFEKNPKYVGLYLNENKDILYCSSAGELTPEPPINAKLYDESKIIRKPAPSYEIYNAALELLPQKFNWEMKAMDGFYILYSKEYFYVLDNQLNLLWE